MPKRHSNFALREFAARSFNSPTGVRLSSAVNSGYGEHGASHSRPALENFKSSSRSPEQDIYPYLTTLRSRSRVLNISAPLATSAIRSLRTSVVGRGLHLHSMPDFEALGIEREEAKAWAQDVERKFEIWAADRMSADLLGMNDFYELQQLAYKSWKESGDLFALFRYGKRNVWRPYALRLQLLEADRVCSPYFTGDSKATAWPYLSTVELKNGNKCYLGVEVDKTSGEVVAYHVASDYPQNGLPLTFTRVEKIGKATGMLNILHLMDAERPGQLRGVPLIAPVIEPLLQLARYLNAEALAALLETYHSGYITTPDADKPILAQPQSAKEGEEEERDLSQLSPEPGGIFQLYPGENIVFNDVKRPGTQFAPFTEACARYIGAALEIPGDVLLKAYNSSYSASRAALQDYWRKVVMERDWFASDFCAPVFEAWLTEAIALGDVKAPGFFTNAVLRRAWCRHQWNGSAMPHLDPVKEANAMETMVRNGWVTNEQATTQLNGGDWDANIADLAHEMDKLQAVQGLLTTAAKIVTPSTSTDTENDPSNDQ